MNKKLKIALIAIEAFLLVVLILVAIGYQQKWIIQIGEGPRFDWYEIQEDLTIDIQDIVKPNKKPQDNNEPEEPETPSESESTNRPEPNNPPPAVTPDPEETEEPEASTTVPLEPEEPNAPIPTDNWETDEF